MNTKVFVIVLAVVCVAAVLNAQTRNSPRIFQMGQQIDSGAARAPLFEAGGWAVVDCSNVAAARSEKLNPWSRYCIQCGDDSHVAWGGETIEANAGRDGYLPKGSWLSFLTTDANRYVSCLNANEDSDCRLIECR